MLEKRTFHFVGYFSGNAEEPPNQEIQTSALGLEFAVTYARSLHFVYFTIRIDWNCPFLMSLMNFFSYMSPRFCQNLSHHRTNNHNIGVNSPYQISSKPILNPGEDWREMHWLMLSSKDSMCNTESYSNFELNCQI